MSVQTFPSFPGLDIAITRTPEFKSVVQEAWSGVETVIGQRRWPRWRYGLVCNVLRDEDGEIDRLLAFFAQHRGQSGEFLFVDPAYNRCTRQTFGLGDGVSTSFRLARAISDWLEPVFAPGADARVYAGVAEASGYQISASGWVEFASAPAAGTLLSWSGSYAMPVRFADDKLKTERIDQRHWKCAQFELISKVRP